MNTYLKDRVHYYKVVDNNKENPIVIRASTLEGYESVSIIHFIPKKEVPSTEEYFLHHFNNVISIIKLRYLTQ